MNSSRHEKRLSMNRKNMTKNNIALIWTGALLCTAPTLVISLGWGGVAPVIPFLMMGLLKGSLLLIFISIVYGLIYGAFFYFVSWLLAGLVVKTNLKIRTWIVVVVAVGILSVGAFPLYSVGGAGGGYSGANLLALFL